MNRKKYKITNADFTLEIGFDNIVYTLKSMAIDAIDANISTYVGAGQNGSTITNRTYGTRDVTIIGYVLADNEEDMKARKAQLQRVVAPMQDFFIVVDNTYKLKVTANSSIEYKSDFYLNNEQLTYFTIDGFAAYPFFEAMNNINAEIAGWIKSFHFPVTFKASEPIVFGHKNPATIIQLANAGEVEVGMVINIKAINGTIINPYLMNVTTGDVLKVNTTLASGDEMVINTNYRSKSIVNVTQSANLLKYFAVESTFLQMPVGVSSFKYGCDSASTGTIQCSVSYMPTFVDA